MGENNITQEILQRITRIEAKIDGYNNLREKLDNTYTVTVKNESDIKDIKDIKDNQKWLWRTIAGALIVAFIGASIVIK